MKHTKNLSRLHNITNIRIAKNISEVGNLKNKIYELETIKLSLMEDYKVKELNLNEVINSSVSKITEYYKTRSEISSLNAKKLIISSRIENIEDDINELNALIFNLNEEVTVLFRKKKKYNKLLTEGF